MNGWMEAIGVAIQYIEEHITEALSVDEFPDEVNERTKVFAISRETWNQIRG